MNQDVRKILARNVMALRTKSKLTRENLSIALDFDNSYISKLEKEKVNITLDKLTKIANYFGVKVVQLLK
ncbi:MAG: helix-turn-helix transcriptional regulator [Clostridium sp.]|nr:helix-turn-helix transcriptional regulator [Clostridium sp.]